MSAARAQLTGRLDAEGARDALRSLIRVGTSAGGARAKAVVAFNPRTSQIRSNQLDAPDGYEQWLIKLDGVVDPSREDSTVASPLLGPGAPFGRIEFAYHRMAVAAGITMSACAVLPEGPRAHFLTRRFDRLNDGERVHMQSLSAMAHLDFNLARVHSYASYLQTIVQLGMTTDDLAQAFRRVAFNVFTVNRNDHTKNLAFVHRREGTWELAPAYDITYAYNPDGRWTSAHQMSVNGKFDAISLADLRELADRFSVPGINRILSEVASSVDRWPEFAAEAGLDSRLHGAVVEDIGRATAIHRPR